MYIYILFDIVPNNASFFSYTMVSQLVLEADLLLKLSDERLISLSICNLSYKRYMETIA